MGENSNRNPIKLTTVMVWGLAYACDRGLSKSVLN